MSNPINNILFACVIALTACLPCRVAKASSIHVVTWFDGSHPVTLSLSAKVEPVVKVATDMFQSDMKEVTGQRAQLSDAKTAAIRVVQLDREPSLARKLSAMGFPVDSLKRYKEAFCIRPVDDKQVWVVGSDARGTAYGVLELSRLAGVSPWTWWGDVYPERKSRLTLPTDYRTFQHPSVEYRC